ncbi:MAG: hypothetical protein M9894_00235 [Planctomycetes bacterium]|nr:hypothetical protein [Planctomycetota bacterium]
MITVPCWVPSLRTRSPRMSRLADWLSSSHDEPGVAGGVVGDGGVVLVDGARVEDPGRGADDGERPADHDHVDDAGAAVGDEVAVDRGLGPGDRRLRLRVGRVGVDHHAGLDDVALAVQAAHGEVDPAVHVDDHELVVERVVGDIDVVVVAREVRELKVASDQGVDEEGAAGLVEPVLTCRVWR